MKLRLEERGAGGEVTERIVDVGDGEKVTIGRGESAAVRIEEESLDRLHAALISDGAFLDLIDLGSRGGTFLNGARVTKASVASGDEVRIGRTTWIVRVDDETAEGRTLRRRPRPPSIAAILVAAFFGVLVALAGRACTYITIYEPTCRDTCEAEGARFARFEDLRHREASRCLCLDEGGREVNARGGVPTLFGEATTSTATWIGGEVVRFVLCFVPGFVVIELVARRRRSSGA